MPSKTFATRFPADSRWSPWFWASSIPYSMSRHLKLAQVEYVASPLDAMVAMSKPSAKTHLFQEHSYVNPGHHEPTSPNYNATKSVLPINHVELFEKSVPAVGDNGKLTRWTKEGTGKRATYHRFQEHEPGEFHWNGSTNGVTKSGQSRAIKINHVPGSVQ